MALKIGTYFLFCMMLSAIKPPIITVSPLKTETCVWTVRFVDLGLSVDISAAGFSAGDTVAVVATVRGTDADDPMVGCMLSGTASHNSASFAFTDALPTSTYKLDLLASV